ncbi:uncharacterized protein LOC144175005 [Haemaphysalis longicornis]
MRRTAHIATLQFLALTLVLVTCPLSSASSSPGRPRGQRALSCFQCSWLAEQAVDEDRSTATEKRWNETYRDEEHRINNPFKPPLIGVETFSETPTRSQLADHCRNCSKIDGACARWTFYGNTGQPVNITWMCVNTLERGCFVENMGNHFTKEVCLCSDRHHCNAAPSATASAVLPLAVALFLCVGWLMSS